jgi:hypothetical protein
MRLTTLLKLVTSHPFLAYSLLLLTLLPLLLLCSQPTRRPSRVSSETEGNADL